MTSLLFQRRLQAQFHPDYVIIKLDPSDEDFTKAIKTALLSRQVFDKYKLGTFIKTIGKTGIHLYITTHLLGLLKQEYLKMEFV